MINNCVLKSCQLFIIKLPLLGCDCLYTETDTSSLVQALRFPSFQDGYYSLPSSITQIHSKIHQEEGPETLPLLMFFFLTSTGSKLHAEKADRWLL